jgi:hypothetical protein
MKMNKQLLESTLQSLNTACMDSEDINQNPHIGLAIENLKQLIDLAVSIERVRE